MKRKMSKEEESVFDAVITFYLNENWDEVDIIIAVINYYIKALKKISTS